MSLKHEFTLQNLKEISDLRVIAFEGVAIPNHYKALYQVQKVKCIGISHAIVELLENSEFAEQCLKYINSPENYSKCMQYVTDIHHSYSDIEIPTREADFIVEVEEEKPFKIFFYLEEGVELNINGNEIFLHRILVDNFTDTLLYNAGDGWTEYKYETKYKDCIQSKVALAFKNYLADKELLGD